MNKKKIIIISGISIAIIAMFSLAFWFISKKEISMRNENQKEVVNEVKNTQDVTNQNSNDIKYTESRDSEDIVEINTKEDANKVNEELNSIVDSIGDF